MPPEVYIGGPYQSPPGAPQPMTGATHPYPVTNLRDGYAPYADPGLGANAFPSPQGTDHPGAFSTHGAQNGGGHQPPGPGYTQMPYQEGHSPADFQRPPQQPW